VGSLGLRARNDRMEKYPSSYSKHLTWNFNGFGLTEKVCVDNGLQNGKIAIVQSDSQQRSQGEHGRRKAFNGRK
jgi:hypothetical protein